MNGSRQQGPGRQPWCGESKHDNRVSGGRLASAVAPYLSMRSFQWGSAWAGSSPDPAVKKLRRNPGISAESGLTATFGSSVGPNMVYNHAIRPSTRHPVMLDLRRRILLTKLLIDTYAPHTQEERRG